MRILQFLNEVLNLDQLLKMAQYKFTPCHSFKNKYYALWFLH